MDVLALVVSQGVFGASVAGLARNTVKNHD